MLVSVFYFHDLVHINRTPFTESVKKITEFYYFYYLICRLVFVSFKILSFPIHTLFPEVFLSLKAVLESLFWYWYPNFFCKFSGSQKMICTHPWVSVEVECLLGRNLLMTTFESGKPSVTLSTTFGITQFHSKFHVASPQTLHCIVK